MSGRSGGSVFRACSGASCVRVPVSAQIRMLHMRVRRNCPLSVEFLEPGLFVSSSSSSKAARPRLTTYQRCCISFVTETRSGGRDRAKEDGEGRKNKGQTDATGHLWEGGAKEHRRKTRRQNTKQGSQVVTG